MCSPGTLAVLHASLDVFGVGGGLFKGDGHVVTHAFREGDAVEVDAARAVTEGHKVEQDHQPHKETQGTAQTEQLDGDLAAPVEPAEGDEGHDSEAQQQAEAHAEEVGPVVEEGQQAEGEEQDDSGQDLD